MQGLEIIFRVGLAILQYNQTDLIQLDMEGMSQVSSHSFIPLCAEMSFVYRFSHKSQAPTFPFACKALWTRDEHWKKKRKEKRDFALLQ